MFGPTPDHHDGTCKAPGTHTPGVCFCAEESGLQGPKNGGSTGTPGDISRGRGPWVGDADDLKELAGSLPLLDPERYPCNHEPVDHSYRLPDDDLPPPEWQAPPITDREAGFWHSGHAHERNQVYRAYRAMGRHRVLHRFVNCGSGVRLLRMADGVGGVRFALASFKCHDRWCPLCARLRSGVYGRNVSAYLAERRPRIRFVTLTLRHNNTPLRDQIQRLIRSFNALKRRKWWEARVNGGVMFIEIKVGRDSRWHVHAHMIVEGDYLAQKELSHEWHAVTGDSPVVDVRDIKDQGEAVRYVAKYGSKPCDKSVVDNSCRLREAIEALQRVRLATTFGSWRKSIKLNDRTDPDKDKWIDCGPMTGNVLAEWLPTIEQYEPQLAERLISWFLKQSGPPSG